MNQKEKNNYLTKSNGITLIAILVIVIVLIILAGIGINFILGETQYEPTTVEEAKKNYMNKKTIVTDSLLNEVVIPEGFKVSEESGASTEEGIVIVDKKGNEFVWIPVPLEEGETFESKYPRTEFSKNQETGSLTAVYKEPNKSGYDTEEEEYAAMLASVNANKGFYIGRYEIGFEGDTAKTTYTSYEKKPTQEDIEKETSKLVVKKDAQIYNYVPWGSSTYDITAYNKGSRSTPKYVIGAVELATNFDEVNNYSGATSTLMYGIQWDRVLRYVSDENHNVNNSITWGNYSNSTGDAATDRGRLQTAGKNEAWQVKKIYDLAGNVMEWTMESYTSSNYRVNRGRLFQLYGI